MYAHRQTTYKLTTD